MLNIIPRLRRTLSLTLAFALVLLVLAPASEANKGKPGTAPAKGKPVTAPAAAAATRVNNPGVEGQWGGVIQLQDVPIHASLLPDGRLLYWSRDKAADGHDRNNGCNTYTVNPFNPDDKKTIPNTTTNLFCSGHSFLPDGRLVVTGGHDRVESHPAFEGFGEKDINIFDPKTDSWKRLDASLARGRWYPFNVTREDGSVVVLYGSYWDGSRAPDGRPLKSTDRIPEKLVVTGDIGTLRSYSDINPRPEITYYPYLHLTPDGKVLVAGPITNAEFGEANSFIFDPDGNNQNGSITNIGDPNYGFFLGSSTLYDAAEGKVLMVGGSSGLFGGTVSNRAVVSHLAQTIEWRPLAAGMQYPRKYHTTVLLPDGKVLVVGGTQCSGFTFDCEAGDHNRLDGAVLNPELWDPATETWSEMAANPSGIPRGYHSTALLLPDATVFVGGGGLPAMGGEDGETFSCNGDLQDPVACKLYGRKNYEIFRPPYLFLSDGSPAPRPVISNADSQVIGKSPFYIKTPDAQNISSVVLVRLPSVTHGFNQDQRRVVLNFTREGDTLIAAGPASGKEAPPGPYMLFLINQNGTPSVSRMVTVSYQKEGFVAQRSLRHMNRAHVFYRHYQDLELRYMSQTAPGSNTLTTPTDLDGDLTSNPIAVENLDGRLQVFVIWRTDNAVWTRQQTAPGSSTWTSWQRVGGTSSLPAFAAARNLDGRLQVFYRGGDNALWTTAQTSPGSSTWTTHTSLGGTLTSEPAVGLHRDGRIEVFARGTDNALHRTRQLTPGSATWTGWSSLGGGLKAGASVAHDREGRMHLFVRGLDNGVYHRAQTAPDSSSWTNYRNLGGVAFEHPYNLPVATQNADGRLQLFLRWSDNTVRTLWQDAEGNFNSGWQSLWGSVDATVPPPVRGDDGRLFLFVRWNGAFNLYYNAQTSPNSYIDWGGFNYAGDAAHSF